MTQPKAYEPIQGQKYQILTQLRTGRSEWEHCDYAEDRAELIHLISNYRAACGHEFLFKNILLPKKYWRVAK